MLDQPPGSPLRGKYLVRNVTANRCLRAVDALLSLFFRRGPDRPPIEKPRRILLANGAHLGDVVLSTAVLPVLKAALPDAEIGFLVGSWSRDVLADHPLVTRLHCVDHWRLNRAKLSPRHKAGQYFRTRATALREIREQHYEVAIDLYCFFPNSIPLVWRAGVPVRIGYVSGGFGPLLTHALEWVDGERHVTEYQAELLRFVLGDAFPEALSLLRPLLAAPSPARECVSGLIQADDYLVLHPGAGAAHKQWPSEKWRGLALGLLARGHRLIFTGNGEAETRQIAELTAGLVGCVNLCGRLNWRDYVAVVAGARLTVGADSVIGHVAAAVRTPCVVAFGGVVNPAHWRPRGEPCRVLTHPVPCAPCYRSGGCEGMECLRGVEVGHVLEAIDALLRDGRQAAA